MNAADQDPGRGRAPRPADAAPAPPDYAHWQEIPTRWADNDAYGHMNNTVHYAFMDTAINTWLVEQGGLDYREGPVIGMCVESHCVYTAEAGFPETLAVGLSVGHLGTSSVRYELGLYRSDRRTRVAEGHFVHVFCDRRTRRPVPVEGRLRTALEKLRRNR
ncbi:acyl-CoA thioesterase [Streptomonospora nanhaiensis]|uniref:Acyl-CoA thioester hydrolase n=1 Tax=Streptomonospora nanhaiensis TaxID=1323731 RepID=A0A853BPN4_9ACTN|nr:thioesterase family protein [Streptomonospora nanhaiensis]NYI96567.1 acyl-CoA thioester hydrolase [Streptomonospora nanhaiensis]